jgi:hypothetical protein
VGPRSEVTHVVEGSQLLPLRGVIEEGVVLLCEGLPDGVVVRIERHDGRRDDAVAGLNRGPVQSSGLLKFNLRSWRQCSWHL